MRSLKLAGPFSPRLKPGFIGNAMLCGGGGQYGYFLSVKDPPKPEGAFTVTAWVKPSGGQWITRILYFKAGWLRREGFEVQLSSTRLSLVLCPAGAKKETRHWLATSLPVQVQHWAFLTVCYDGEAWRLYLNGLLMREERSGKHAYVPPPEGVPLNIGGYSLHTNNTYVGLIDQVRVWPRALNRDEVEKAMLADMRDADAMADAH